MTSVSPPARPKRRRRTFLYAMMAISIVLCVIYTLLWMMGARGIKTAIHDFVIEQRANGMIVEHGAVTSKGFPFLLRTRIENVHMGQDALWDWRSEAVFIDALPYALDRMIFSAVGDQRVHLDQGQAPFNIWTGRGATLRASIASKKDTQWAFVLQIEQASFISQKGEATMSADKLVVNIAPLARELTSIGASLAADKLSWQRKNVTPRVNVPIDRTEIALNISHTDELGDDGDLRQWGAMGGVLTLDHFVINDLPATLSAAGFVGVNENGQANGQFNTVLSKPANFLTSLDQLGLVPPNQKDALTTGLAISSFAGGGTIKTLFEIRGGQVLANGAPIADLPAVP